MENELARTTRKNEYFMYNSCRYNRCENIFYEFIGKKVMRSVSQMIYVRNIEDWRIDIGLSSR